jgi:NAD(P)-dependent dehydrogenase (short-subunit alcohol dehydrogenase family)
MSNVWSYEGKRVVVSGGGGAGMGAAVVRELTDLGAEIHTIDLKEPPVPVASHRVVDLRDPAAVAVAIDAIGGRIDALFNCAGLPGAPFSDLDTMLVNFAAPRLLAELCRPHMPAGSAVASIASTAGANYLSNIAKWMPLVSIPDFAGAKAWCEENPKDIDSGYVPSKEALILWTMYAASDYATDGIRVNCISPGPTDTPMMPDFEKAAPAALINEFAKCLGRRSTPEEQAYPMVFLNSAAASYISGENLNTDGGTTGGLTTGRLAIDLSSLGM